MILNLFKRDKEIEFWKWFQKNSHLYVNFENNREPLFDLLAKKLKNINPDLTFEFSPLFENGVRELVISADGIKSSFPAVENLVSKAPEILDWKIIAFRQPKKGYDGVDIGDVSVRNDDVYFRYSEMENAIGLELYIRNYEENSDWASAIYIMLDNVIGEYDVETFIDWIERKKLDESEIEILYNIEELPEILQELKKEVFNL